jgi:hypothetical protein
MRLLLILSILLNIIAATSYDQYEYVDDPCSGEEIHWSVTPYNPYQDTLIITNPYD